MLSSLISAYSADAPKDNGGSEILKYLLEITDGTSEGDTLETVLHNASPPGPHPDVVRPSAVAAAGIH